MYLWSITDEHRYPGFTVTRKTHKTVIHGVSTSTDQSLGERDTYLFLASLANVAMVASGGDDIVAIGFGDLGRSGAWLLSITILNSISNILKRYFASASLKCNKTKVGKIVKTHQIEDALLSQEMT